MEQHVIEAIGGNFDLSGSHMPVRVTVGHARSLYPIWNVTVHDLFGMRCRVSLGVFLLVSGVGAVKSAEVGSKGEWAIDDGLGRGGHGGQGGALVTSHEDKSGNPRIH